MRPISVRLPRDGQPILRPAILGNHNQSNRVDVAIRHPFGRDRYCASYFHYLQQLFELKKFYQEYFAQKNNGAN